MTRKELILSDSYIETYIECIVVSKKTVGKTRKELLDFILEYRDELLSLSPNIKVEEEKNYPATDLDKGLEYLDNNFNKAISSAPALNVEEEPCKYCGVVKEHDKSCPNNPKSFEERHGIAQWYNSNEKMDVEEAAEAILFCENEYNGIGNCVVRKLSDKQCGHCENLQRYFVKWQSQQSSPK